MNRSQLLRVVATCLLACACGDDNGSAGSDGSQNTGMDAGSDGFIRTNFPDNIGAPCDPNNPNATQQNPAPDCGMGTDYRCEAPDFFGCTPGFCAKVCSTTQPCATGATCFHAPRLASNGTPSELDRCFLPCNTSDDCGAPGRLYCDTARHICSVGQFLENLGSIGARQPDGNVCTTPPATLDHRVFGANVNASGTSGRPSEPFVAIDPSNTDIAYVVYNGGGSTVSVTQNASAGAAATFTQTALNTIDADDAGDPVVAIDSNTHDVWTVYLTGGTGGCGPGGALSGNNAIKVIHASQGFLSPSQPIVVNDAMYTSANYFNDKPWLHVTADGSIYVSWTAFPTAANAVTSDIVLASSHDHGATWHNTVVSDTTMDRAHGRQLSGLASDAANHLYIVWTEDTGNASDAGGYTWFAKSTDGGLTVTHPNIRVHSSPEATFDDPQIAVTPDGSKLYVVYTAVPLGVPLQPDEQDVKATFSTDGGATWATPIFLHDDHACATHWHPAAAIDAAGNLWVVYYDGQFGNGAVAWVKAGIMNNQLLVLDHSYVTDAPGPFTTSRTNFFLGDYIGLSIANGKMAAVWGDLRDVVASGSGGTRIYFSYGTVQ